MGIGGVKGVGVGDGLRGEGVGEHDVEDVGEMRIGVKGVGVRDNLRGAGVRPRVESARGMGIETTQEEWL